VGLPLRWSTGLGVWSAQYFVSGLAALSLELVWFRMLELLIKSVSLTFAVLLAIYLGSLAVGTLVGTRLLGASARQRERWFLLAQIGLYAYTAASVWVLVGSLGRVPALQFLRDYFYSGEPVLDPGFAVITYGLIPLFLLFVPTFLMGLSFSLSQSLVQEQPDEVGRKVGWLQFVNIAGSALGAWAVTWLGFPIIGTAGLVLLIGGLSFVYLLVLAVRQHLPLWGIGILAIGCGLLLGKLPDNQLLWQRLNGMGQPQLFLYDENESAVSIIKVGADKRSGSVFVNGLSQSRMPFVGDPVHTVLGALPVLLHPNPERVAVIGLGSGGTLNGMAGRAETRQIDCFEIATNQPAVLSCYGAVARDMALQTLLRDPRLNLVLHDGRYALRHGTPNEGIVKYDVIEADALRPSSAYSGNLYSREYFELLRSRLRPGGFAVTWCPTVRVLNTFRLVFPHIVYTKELLLIGSNEPILLDWNAVMARAASAFSTRHYGRSGIDITTLLNQYRASTRLITPLSVAPTEINTDLFPKDEYSIRTNDQYKFSE
jgi:spermidine synthase